jgi:hypothetical protein
MQLLVGFNSIDGLDVYCLSFDKSKWFIICVRTLDIIPKQIYGL